MTILLWVRYALLIAMAGVVALYVWTDLRSDE